jgi:quinol-cytochrome oxidoreductase complex cytochrome b subunit
MSDTEAGTDAVPSKASALFDLRTVIAALFLVYGVVLTVMGFVSDSPEELAKAGGIDINLWSGIAMIVVGAIFVAWALLRPLQPPVAEEE